MSKILVAVLALVIGYTISWGITVGVIKLITMCFFHRIFLACCYRDMAGPVPAEIGFS